MSFWVLGYVRLSFRSSIWHVNFFSIVSILFNNVWHTFPFLHTIVRPVFICNLLSVYLCFIISPTSITHERNRLLSAVPSDKSTWLYIRIQLAGWSRRCIWPPTMNEWFTACDLPAEVKKVDSTRTEPASHTFDPFLDEDSLCPSHCILWIHVHFRMCAAVTEGQTIIVFCWPWERGTQS